MTAWHINTLMSPQNTIVLYLGYNGWSIDANDQHV